MESWGPVGSQGATHGLGVPGGPKGPFGIGGHKESRGSRWVPGATKGLEKSWGSKKVCPDKKII